MKCRGRNRMVTLPKGGITTVSRHQFASSWLLICEASKGRVRGYRHPPSPPHL